LAMRALSLGLTLGVALVGFGGLHYSPGAAAAGNGWVGHGVPAKRVYFRPVSQRMGQPHATSTRWRPQPGVSTSRYGYAPTSRYATEAPAYRARSVPAVESAAAAQTGGWTTAMPGQGFRPGSASTLREPATSPVEAPPPATLNSQFRPAPKVRKPSYEELQARNSFRGYHAPQYGSYPRNVGVPSVYFGSPWPSW
jgi:hypothetical protein